MYDLLPLTIVLDWKTQRRMWVALSRQAMMINPIPSKGER
jgi:hypothetical protein